MYTWLYTMYKMCYDFETIESTGKGYSGHKHEELCAEGWRGMW